MKKSNIIRYILHSLLYIGMQMGTLCTPSMVQAQESIVVHEKGTNRTDTIELPTSMSYPLDSLLHDWKAKTYISPNKDCSTSDINPQFSDSIYIDRLSRMPTVIEMPYNEVVRACIDRYTGKLRNQVSFMLSAANFYMPIIEEALDAYDLPL